MPCSFAQVKVACRASWLTAATGEIDSHRAQEFVLEHDLEVEVLPVGIVALVVCGGLLRLPASFFRDKQGRLSLGRQSMAPDLCTELSVKVEKCGKCRRSGWR